MVSRAERVILLHGLARGAGSMKKLEKALLKNDYSVRNVSYASTHKSIEQLAEEAIGPELKLWPAEYKFHFVTHSLGGILVRQYLSLHEIASLGRVVMLGPPNKGSQLVDRLGSFPGFHLINGDAGLQLGTGEGSVPNRLGAANFDLGIIAGTRSIDPILSHMIAGVNDGKVSVENTKLEGMRDHIEMDVTHTFMMRNNKVIEQVIHYLENGRFSAS